MSHTVLWEGDGECWTEHLIQPGFDHVVVRSRRDVVTEAWPTYESRVRNYYGTIDALVERRQALTRHVAIFGLIGFLCEVFTAAALVTMILVPICNESASPWLGCWTR